MYAWCPRRPIRSKDLERRMPLSERRWRPIRQHHRCPRRPCIQWHCSMTWYNIMMCSDSGFLRHELGVRSMRVVRTHTSKSPGSRHSGTPHCLSLGEIHPSKMICLGQAPRISPSLAKWGGFCLIRLFAYICLCLLSAIRGGCDRSRPWSRQRATYVSEIPKHIVIACLKYVLM